MSIEWNNKFETNISEIDTQHKRLFFLLGEVENLYNNNKGNLSQKSKEIKEAISALEQYTLSHFLIEERVMEDNDYPDLENHKELHNKFTDKIFQGKEQMMTSDFFSDEAKVDDFLQHLIKFLNTWLTNHIMVKDMDYKPYIRHTL
ncbi:MAG: hemerythrin family protein [Leptospira sp.]|nr:hemerythrin family protein [Leptospira sp.]